MFTRGHKISGSAAGAATLLFFMPWVLISCDGQPVASFSGWQLAAGGIIQTAFGPQALSGSPEIFLVLLTALGSLAVIYFAYRGQLALRRATYALIGLAGLTLLFLLIRFAGADSEAARETGANIRVQMRFGYWLTLLAQFAIIGGAVADLRSGISQATSPAIAAALPATESPPSGMACVECGANNIVGSRFCMTCGKELLEQPAH